MHASNELTPRQQEIYDYIRDKIHCDGYGPTVREIGKHFGIKSPNGVRCNILALKRKGAIKNGSLSRTLALVHDDTVRVKRSDLEKVREMVVLHAAGPETIELIDRMLGGGA